jgi:hypothetical protein
MIRKLAIAVAICAVLPLGTAAARGLPFIEHHPSEPALRSDLARVYFYRPLSMVGGALQPYVLVDGYGVGVSRTGRYFYYDFAPGTHVVSATTEKEESATVPLTAGQTVYVRFHGSFGVMAGHIVPELVSADQGQTEIKDCDFDDDGMN